jgi:hypothetical protein
LRGRAGEGGLCRFEDPFNDAIDIRHDVIIRKAQHAPSEVAQIGGTPFVGFGCRGMRFTVELDDEAASCAGEICDERPDGCLAPKVHAIDASTTELCPELSLRLGRVGAQLTGISKVLALAHLV